jgi:hypothetical protein
LEKKRILQEKMKYFAEYAKEFDRICAEMNVNYDAVLAKAQAKRKSHLLLDNVMKAADMDGIEKNIHAKVEFYKKIKEFVY